MHESSPNEHWTRVIAPSRIRYKLWTIPGVDSNYAPPVVFPHITNQRDYCTWPVLVTTLDKNWQVLCSDMDTQVFGRLRRQGTILAGNQTRDWYNQNSAAAPWYASLLIKIVSEACTIKKYEGPILAILFLVSLAALRSVQ